MQAAAFRLIHRDGCNVADKGAGRIKITHHAFIFRLQQIVPGTRHRRATQRINIDHKAHGTGVQRYPLASRIFHACRDLIPVCRFVSADHVCADCLNTEADAVIDHVGDRIAFLGDQLRQRLTRIFIILRHMNARRFFDRLELCRPVGPLWRAVVADSIFSRLRPR